MRALLASSRPSKPLPLEGEASILGGIKVNNSLNGIASECNVAEAKHENTIRSTKTRRRKKFRVNEALCNLNIDSELDILPQAWPVKDKKALEVLAQVAMLNIQLDLRFCIFDVRLALSKAGFGLVSGLCRSR